MTGIALTPAGLAALQQRLADESAIETIETYCVRSACRDDVLQHRMWDTRPMLDAREHCNEVLDMLQLRLLYAELRGLIERDAKFPHLVRINPLPEPQP